MRKSWVVFMFCLLMLLPFIGMAQGPPPPPPPPGLPVGPAEYVLLAIGFVFGVKEIRKSS